MKMKFLLQLAIITRKKAATIIIFGFIHLLVSTSPLIAQDAAKADPLQSWNDQSAKQQIIGFVTAVTTKGNPKYVAPAERIATFDNDGTLWCEQPVVQGAFILYRLTKMVENDPSLKERQPFKAALENDKAYLKTEGMPAILELFSATHAGMTDEEFSAEVREFMAAAKHPKFGRGFGELTYQPMIELLEYLRSHGFKTFICSGGGIDFMRAISESLYGIPPEQVIGSSGKKVFAEGEDGWSMTRTGELSFFNDKNDKAVNIDLHIGRRPLIAMGNVRSHGDIGMCAYSQGRKGPSLQLLVNHDDAVREFSYAEDDGGSLKAAKANGWIVVSVNKDWNVVFSTEEEK
ncbi:HAD family hydrolase [Thermodesulfobacteriota bacterium]